MYLRENTKKIKIGSAVIGGGEPILIQSMTNTKTYDTAGTVKQINELAALGCEIIRVAVPDMDCAKTIDKIKEKISIPLVCDIHFDYRLALECIERGADKIRINPGNIGDDSRAGEVAKAAKAKGIPIRIGVNGGSLEKEILKKYQKPTAEAILESAKYHIQLLERFDMDDIIVSLKSSDVLETVSAYMLFADTYNYPLHLGITEAGTAFAGGIKSAVGIGNMLISGIGDTIRVSITGNPETEVKAAVEILKAAGLRSKGAEVISCPTCGRCSVNLEKIAMEMEAFLKNVKKPLKVAVMGCVVNGPGEAREADIGVACGKGEGLIFKKGEILKKVKENQVSQVLIEEIKKII